MPTLTTQKICMGGQSPYLLNQVSGIKAIYSLRRQKDNQLYAMRVRRSSDDAEQNIGFICENLDIGSLLSFCGVGSGFVKTIYDPANNNDAIQLTASNQPRIVNSGIVDRDFDATKCALRYPTFASASGVNLVSNGDFSNGTTGWTTAPFNCTVSASSNILSATGGNASSVFEAIQLSTIPVTVGKRYFFRVKVKVTDAVCQSLSLRLTGSTSGTAVQVGIQSSPVNGTQYTLTGVGTMDSTHIGNVKIAIRATYADAATANGKVMEIQEVVCIDVTDLGQPALYFDGTNDVMTIANSSSVDILSQPLLMNSVVNCQTASDGWIMSKNLDSALTTQYGVVHRGSNQTVLMYLEGEARQTATVIGNTQQVYTATLENTTPQGYVNGTPSGSTGNYASTLTPRANMNIGARSNSVLGTAWLFFFKGYISEIIISTNPSIRQKIERNQGKYFNQNIT